MGTAELALSLLNGRSVVIDHVCAARLAERRDPGWRSTAPGRKRTLLGQNIRTETGLNLAYPTPSVQPAQR